MGAPELANNIALLGHRDQGGRGDGVQVMVGGGDARQLEPAPAARRRAAAGGRRGQPVRGEAFADESAYDGRSVGEVLAANPPSSFRAGMQVYDPAAPRGVGAFVPPAPERLHDTRPDRPRVIQGGDVFVDREAVMYVTDHKAGLYVLQDEPGSS